MKTLLLILMLQPSYYVSTSDTVVSFTFTDSIETGTDTIMITNATYFTGTPVIVRMRTYPPIAIEETQWYEIKHWSKGTWGEVLAGLTIFLGLCGIVRVIIKTVREKEEPSPYDEYIRDALSPKEYESLPMPEMIQEDEPLRKETCKGCGELDYTVKDGFDVCDWCGKKYERETETTEYRTNDGKKYLTFTNEIKFTTVNELREKYNHKEL